MTGVLTANVHNLVGGNLLFSNQNLAEKNVEIIYKIDGIRDSFEAILKILSEILTDSEIDKTELRDMLSSLTKTDLRSVDILIYLITTYPKLIDDLKSAMLKILFANKLEFQKLMKNFGVN